MMLSMAVAMEEGAARGSLAEGVGGEEGELRTQHLAQPRGDEGFDLAEEGSVAARHARQELATHLWQ